jgi:pSer/pThr/pTyr-binding forkhead associated (FHA) protein
MSASQCHLLKIDDEMGSRTITLDAATYSLGRDSNNAIILACKNISRKQALLLRLPTDKRHDYRYRLMDGDSTGKPSKNGMLVNGLPNRSRDLQSGDQIVFAGRVKVFYQLLPIAQTGFLKYLNLSEINFHSIKLAARDAVATVPKEEEEVNSRLDWLAEFSSDETTLFS